MNHKFFIQNSHSRFQILYSRFILLFCILVFVFYILTGQVNAQGASLYLSPNSGTFFVGSTFDVSVFINTGGNNINAVMVDLKFDPRKIQIASPSTGKSFISVWVAQPTYSNVEGTATFRGGIPNPGINTSSGLVSTITFRAVAPGETAISFLDSSRVLLNDGKGTNILSSLDTGAYKLVIPPPQGPEVFSPTHPDQNKWYNNNSPTISWEKDELVSDFSYSIDKSLFENPDSVSEGGHTSVSFTDLEDGVWYFHIKAKSDDAWGGVSNYILQIDKTQPASFQLGFKPTPKTNFTVPEESILIFITTDNLSGISHYLLKLMDLNNRAGKEEGFFTEIFSPYKLPRLEPGQYEVVVRAFDNAQNFRDSSQKIEVIPADRLFYISRRGVSVFTIFAGWPKIVLILFSLLAVTGWFGLWELRHYKEFRQAKNMLKETEEKLRKNKEDIGRKLYG